MSDLTNTPIAQEIDAVGLLCPLPILRFKKRIKDLDSGSIVHFFADDPTGRKDLESLCHMVGHTLEDVTELEHGVVCYRVVLA